MARANQVPPARPDIILTLDADEAELVLALMETVEPEEIEDANRRMTVAGALTGVGVKSRDVQVRPVKNVTLPEPPTDDSPVREAADDAAR